MKELTRQKITAIADQDKRVGIRAKFDSDTERAKQFSYELGDVFFDFSKTHINSELFETYKEFAAEIGFENQRHQLFAGAKINCTEERSVLHTLLRDSDNQGIDTQEKGVLSQAKEAEQQLNERYTAILGELSHREYPVTDVIHVGIGGSSLGTQLLFEALVSLNATINVHFISNVDAHKLVSVLANCDVKSTLVVGVSKTFTTAETLQNINTIGSWFEQNGVNQWKQQIYAVTSYPKNAFAFGVAQDHVVGFPEWVGGRYSVWSAVSLSAIIVIGIERFNEFLEGAALVDQHFYQAELSENVCFLAAMLDHYYANFLNVQSRAIFAYDHRLRSLVDYLQQLETESNGKDRQRNGDPVDQPTSVVVWGGVGTDVQHSVFQMMHQGTSLIPSEFILVKKPDHNLDDHHQELLANGLAQTAALLSGQSLETVKSLNQGKGLTELTSKSKIFSGERPSTTLLLKRLTPFNLGLLLAFYEHRTFCGGVFANINSYDQMGVELGKRLAKSIRPLLDGELNLEEKETVKAGFDSSTLALLNRILSE